MEFGLPKHETLHVHGCNYKQEYELNVNCSKMLESTRVIDVVQL